MSLRFRLAVAAAVLTAALSACSSAGPTEISYEVGSPGIQAGYVSVRATSEGLVVVNQTERPVYTFAIERNAAAYTDWAPCTVISVCGPGLAQGSTTTIPWSSVGGFKPDAVEYILYWYHVDTVNGKPTATAMQNVVVRR